MTTSSSPASSSSTPKQIFLEYFRPIVASTIPDDANKTNSSEMMPLTNKTNQDNNVGSASSERQQHGLEGGSINGRRRAYAALSSKNVATTKLLFPWKLHRLLDDAASENFEDIISWTSSNNGLKVHDPDLFVSMIAPKYSLSSKYKSL